MKEGLEEFLKRIEARPTNETLIDRFVTLVLEEDGLERIYYLKKLVGLLLYPNPYAALKAAALELQEARKEKLDREHQIAALKDVESCFLKLDKEDNALMVREEITKLQIEISRESQSGKPRPAIPDFIPEISPSRNYLSPSERQQFNQFQPLKNVPQEVTQNQRLPSLLKSNREFDDTTSVDDSPPQDPDKEEARPPSFSLPDLELDAFNYAPRPKPSLTESPPTLINKQDSFGISSERLVNSPLPLTHRESIAGFAKFESAAEGAAEPFSSRSIAEAFAARDIYSKNPSDLDPIESSKNRSRESQQAHFPESNLNRSVTRQEIGKFYADEATGTYEPHNQEGTEFLTGARNLDFKRPSVDEQTTKFEPELTQVINSGVPVMSLLEFRLEEAALSRTQNSFMGSRPSLDLAPQPSMSSAQLSMGAEVLEPTASARDIFSMRHETPLSPSPHLESIMNGADKTELRWHLLSERLRLLSGIQVSHNHALSFMQRLLGETAKANEVQSSLGVLLNILAESKNQYKQKKFLILLFEELPPKSLHQLLGTMKIGEQSLAFFSEYLEYLLSEQQFRRALNVIHSIIIAGLDMGWYGEAFRLLNVIWPQLGLKAWQWTEEEGSAAFCIRLAEREELLSATLLA